MRSELSSRQVWAAVAAACILLSSAAAGAETATLDRERALLAALREAAAEGGLPALGAIVLDSAGVRSKAVVGLRKIGAEARVEADDLWHIGSITKSFTSALVARRVAAGELDWDTTVAQLAGPGAESSAFAAVTLRQLLGHRSGLVANLPQTEALRLRASGEPVTAQRAAALEWLLASEPVGAAGETFLYSNAGYIVVGALLERRFGAPWEDQLRELVLEPLRLGSAGFGPPGTQGELDQPRGHSSAGEELRPIEPGPWADNPAFLGPAGTLHLSLDDLGAWVQEHLRASRGGGELLDGPSATVLHGPLADGDYALGWARATAPDGATRIWHNGSNTLWMALVVFDPEADRAVAMVTNGGIAAGPLVDRLADELLRAAGDGAR